MERPDDRLDGDGDVVVANLLLGRRFSLVDFSLSPRLLVRHQNDFASHQKCHSSKVAKPSGRRKIEVTGFFNDYISYPPVCPVDQIIDQPFFSPWYSNIHSEITRSQQL